VNTYGRLLGRPVRTTVLVDSGADATMLDGSLAPVLGIDLSTLPQHSVGGVGAGGVPVARADIRIQLCDHWLNVPVDFTLNPITHPQLLGRDGAFDALVFSFVQLHRTLAAVVL
jgi:hypothetical protein